jgi:hypothetical protein
MLKEADRPVRSARLTRLFLINLNTILIGLSVCFNASAQQGSAPTQITPKPTPIKSIQSPSLDPSNSYLAVSLQPLDLSWRILTQDQVRSLSTIAVVGALNGQKSLGLVLVEPIKQMALNEYATALMDNTSLQELLIESVTEVKYQNQSALRLVYSGDEANGRFRYLSYVFITGQKGYQIVSGGPVSLVSSTSLETFAQAVTLTRVSESTAPQPQATLNDIHGSDWLLIAGQFSHILSGIKLTSTNDWSVIAGHPLKRINHEAIAGLVHKKDQLHILFFDRPCPTKESVQCLSWVQQELYADLGLTPQSDRYEFPALDEKRLFQRLSHDGGLYTYLHHAFIKEGRALQILAWTIAPSVEQTDLQENADLLWRDLPNGLSQAGWLSTIERTQVHLKVSNLEPSDSFVRPYESWMWGQYHHFDSGLLWTQPPGIWKVHSERQQTITAPNSLLTIEAPRYGLKSQLRVSVGHHLNYTTLHHTLWSELRNQLTETRGQCLTPKTTKHIISDITGLRTRCTFIKTSTINTEWTYQLDSFKGSGAVIHMLTWAPKYIFDGDADLVRTSLEKGLALSPPAAIVFTPEHRMIDERFKYQLRNLPPNGTLRIRPSIELGTASSLAEFNTPEVSLVSFAVSKMSPNQLNALVDRIAQNRDQTLPHLTHTQLQRHKVWVHGHPAERLSWVNAQNKMARGALLITIPPLVYGVVAVGNPTQVSDLLQAKTFKFDRK